MLHLFNKVYLEFDSNIELGLDRVVVSETNGFKVAEALDKFSAGELIAFGKTWEETLGDKDFITFLLELRYHQANTNKKIVIYCDKESYKKVIAVWFRAIMPNLDLESFTSIVNYTIYHQRIVNNTQMASVHSLYLNHLWEDFGDLSDVWEESAVLVTDQNIADIGNSNLSFSYEYLLAEYFSGEFSRRQELLDTAFMFTERFFKELFTDSRQMVLLNIENHRFQAALGYDQSAVDITKVDPLSSIEQLAPYSDSDIWLRSSNQYGVCNLRGVSSEKIKAISDLLVYIFDTVEDMETDMTKFQAIGWAQYVSKGHLTQTELDGMLDFVIQYPFDTCLVPRFDFQNVNYTLIQHFINLKKQDNNSALQKYKLL